MSHTDKVAAAVVLASGPVAAFTGPGPTLAFAAVGLALIVWSAVAESDDLLERAEDPEEGGPA